MSGRLRIARSFSKLSSLIGKELNRVCFMNDRCADVSLFQGSKAPWSGRTQSTRLAQDILPVELWEIVIDFLCADSGSLRACRLACKLWGPPVLACLNRILDIRSFIQYQRELSRLAEDPIQIARVRVLNLEASTRPGQDWQDWLDHGDTFPANDLSLFYQSIHRMSDLLPHIREVRLVSTLAFQEWPLQVISETFLRTAMLTLSGWKFDSQSDLIACIQAHHDLTHLVQGPTRCLAPGSEITTPLHLPYLEHLEVNCFKYPVTVAALLLAPSTNFRSLRVLGFTQVSFRSYITETLESLLIEVGARLEHLRIGVNSVAGSSYGQ
jgi:hypothetical protein